jgi:hypothetical protein
MNDLVDGLKRDSEPYARFSNNHAGMSREGGERVFNRPSDGTVRYQQVTLLPAAHSGHELVMLLSQAARIIP